MDSPRLWKEQRLNGNRSWGDQSRCARPAREDSSNLTRTVTTACNERVICSTSVRPPSEPASKSKKGKIRYVGRGGGATSGALVDQKTLGIERLPETFVLLRRPTRVQTLTERWPDSD